MRPVIFILSAFVLFVGLAFFVQPGFQPNPEEVKITFTFPKKPKLQGTIEGFKGSFNFNEQDLANSFISGSVDVTSLKTGNFMRDMHLKSYGYFWVNEFARMSFRSKSIEKKGNKYLMKGELGIRDLRNTIEIEFDFNKSENLFSGNTTFNIADWEIQPMKKSEDNKVEVNFLIPGQ